MRDLSLIVFCAAFSGILACGDTASQTQDPQIESPPGETLTELPELPQGFKPETLPRGNWMNCTGYLTNNASAGFCEDAPPASWSPFMFNGQRYFFVPLGPSA